MRRLALVLAASLLAPASASAAGFGELPFQTVSRGVSCLRATGAPGELVAWAPDGVRLLRATPGGLAAAGGVPLGAPAGCPVAAAQPNGAGVAVAGTRSGRTGAIRVALREPGGGWSAPVTIALPESALAVAVAAAISERGDAVVAWREIHGPDTRIRAVRRAAGGAFGAPQTLAASTQSVGVDSAIAAGIGADGVAMLLWTQPRSLAGNARPDAEAAVGAPGAPFAAPQRLGAGVDQTPVLAVTSDGRALALLSTETGLFAAERAAGAAAFGAGQQVAGRVGSDKGFAIAVRPDGSALAAWGGGRYDGVTIARRDGAGSFGPPIQVVPPAVFTGSFNGGGSVSTGFEDDEVRPEDARGGDMRAVFAPDGRALLSWTTVMQGISWAVPTVATVSADGSAAVQALGGHLRAAGSVTPVLLDGGVPAVAWGDNAPGERGDGRLHLAAEGAQAAPQPAFPKVRVGRPEHSVLRADQALVLPVSCSAACDVRASVHGIVVTASLTRAGRTRLRFGSGSRGVAPVRAARVRVTVASGPPGAATAQTQVVSPRLRRLPDPPVPRILELRAVRSGSAVDVSWRADRSSADVLYWVQSSVQRDREENLTSTDVKGSGLRFHVRLQGVPAKARWVRVTANQQRIGTRSRRASVRIR